MNPGYPIYVISKGRWDIGQTRKNFEAYGMEYKVVVEEQEFDKYAQFMNKDNLLILPKKYLENYETLDDLRDKKSKGPGVARNFCWEHSISLGAKRHWVFDDNIKHFLRLNNNRRLYVGDGTIFKVMEDFVDRYTNVAIAGPNYSFFANTEVNKPYILNTRIYSMLLIDNNIPYRWRGRYNEDTILSLDVLKDGWCTVQFYAFLGVKAQTQTMKGGCNSEFYANEGTINKSRMLCDIHPDVSKLVWKFNRWHHEVNYSSFKENKLLMKKGLVIPDVVNNYGMILKRTAEVEGENDEI